MKSKTRLVIYYSGRRVAAVRGSDRSARRLFVRGSRAEDCLSGRPAVSLAQRRPAVRSSSQVKLHQSLGKLRRVARLMAAEESVDAAAP